MKSPILFLLMALSGMVNIHAQFVYKWDTKFFSFSSPFELTRINTTSADEFNWQNDEYTIEISAFGIGYYNTYYGGQDIKKVAEQVAVDQSFYDIKEMEDYGDSLPLIPSGYYLLAKTPGMDANQYACVIVVVGFSEKRKIYFEARIYCYNNKYKKGIEIAKSFSFDK
jgi:hypothetical protein